MHSKQTNTNKIKLIVAGVMIAVQLPKGLEPAHGVGLDGKTPVKSFSTGESPEHPGKHFIGDVDGNVIRGTADELFVAAQRVAQKEGWKLVATKI